MPLTSAEAQTSSWYPSQQELLLRPLKTAYAIDCPNPIEIDDAPHVTEVGKNDLLVEVHIADGGLLRDTDVLEQARERGWSTYNQDGADRLMLPRPVTKILDLDKKSRIGAPAVTASFGVARGADGKVVVSTVAFEKTRVMCEGLDYDAFRSLCRQHDEQALLIVKAARLLLGHNGRHKLSRAHFAADVVGQFMLTINSGVAQKFDGGPYLFRNHSDQAYAQWEDPVEREFFRKMNIAFYNGVSLGHTALKVLSYCHFTSPLRRFPDLANHVNLRDMMEGREPTYSPADIDDIAREMTQIYMRRSSHFRKLKKAA